MNKKPFDDIEMKLKEAAERYSPRVSEDAWNKMQVLLDKEFSEEKRRPAAWPWALLTLIFIAAGGGVYFYLNNTNLNNTTQKEISTGSNNPKSSIGSAKESNVATKQSNNTDPLKTTDNNANRPEGNVIEQSKRNGSESIPGNPETSDANIVHDQARTNNTVAGPKLRSTKNMMASANSINQPRSSKGTLEKKTKSRTRSNQTLAIHKPGTRVPNDKRGNEISKDLNNSESQNNPSSSLSNEPVKVSTEDRQIQKSELVKTNKPDSLKQAPEAVSQAVKKLNLAKKSSRFYFMGSIASDGNSVKALKVDRVTAMYGLGAGYMITKKLSVQTGVFLGKKDYSAKSGDYYFKPGTYYDTVNIKNITADCFVIDIPLTLRYDIIQGRQMKLYATSGISSYIMKKENYDYVYTYRNMWPMRDRYATHTFTGNKHLFSVVDFSLGLERRLSPTFSITGEPYIKIPLSGVGNGQVKLYSAGLQLGFKFQPLRRSDTGLR